MIAIAGLMFYASTARAVTNVLANPGFETGSISSWTGAGGGCANGAGAAVESTNTIVFNGGTKHVKTHGGTFAGKIYGDFCTAGGSRPSIYQEIGTGAGSVWVGDGFASPQTPDNIGGGNQFWLEVSFRDVSGNILALYRSSVINASSPTDVYTELQVTNQIDPNDLTTVIGNATSYAAPAGTVKVRFQVVFAQTGFDGGSVYFDDLSLNKIAGSDPEISTPPASQTKVQGQTAVFSSSSSGTTALTFEWDKTDTNGTSVLNNGGNISGATTGTLTVSNVAPANAGTYTLKVTDNGGTQSSSAQLKVVPLSQVQTNLLVNPSFEDGVYSEPWESGWQAFNGNHLASTNEFYFLSSTPVSAFDGTYVTQIYPNGNGSYNGLFQDKPAAPGEVYTANAWFLTPSADQIGGNNVCYLEVQFRNAGGGVLAQYSTTNVDATFPTDTWVNLVPTNHRAGDFTTFLGTSPYMVAPPTTASVRFQFTYHAVDAGGSVYVDAADLRLREPVAAASAFGTNKVKITFPTVYGPTYNVLYRTNLNDPTWQTLTNVFGDGTVKTVLDSVGATRRFYVVNTQ